MNHLMVLASLDLTGWVNLNARSARDSPRPTNLRLVPAGEGPGVRERRAQQAPPFVSRILVVELAALDPPYISLAGWANLNAGVFSGWSARAAAGKGTDRARGIEATAFD
jgi:hypothetical protein